MSLSQLSCAISILLLPQFAYAQGLSPTTPAVLYVHFAGEVVVAEYPPPNGSLVKSFISYVPPATSDQNLIILPTPLIDTVAQLSKELAALQPKKSTLVDEPPHSIAGR